MIESIPKRALRERGTHWAPDSGPRVPFKVGGDMMARSVTRRHHPYGCRVEFDTISAAVEEILESMWATDPAIGRFPRESWPHGCCEFAAVALAAALEATGLGQWTFVSAGESGAVGHAWLEWRSADGATLYSIDVTIDQFDEWDEPFIGEGVTPAAEKFSPVRYAGPLWGWPYLGDDRQIFRKLIRAVLDEIGRRRLDLAR